MPKIIGPVPSDKWEREVRRQLNKQLPDHWIVICNVSWALNNKSGYVQDGQADFVVLVPELGLAVVEVKGSRLVSVHENGEWYIEKKGSGGMISELKLKKPPPEQANGNMHTLASLVAGELGQLVFPGLYAWLVVYPNGEVEGKFNTYDESTIVTKKHLHQLGGKIKDALLAKGDESRGKSFTEDFAGRAAKILTNQHFRVVAVDTELDTVEDENNIDELTRQQFAALQGAFELPRVAIIGPAGSGKTLLAIWKLSALLEEGRKAIFVCFNKKLAKWLRNKHPDMVDSIVNVDKLFLGIVDDKSGASGNDFFSEVLPVRVMDSLFNSKENQKYDAIIIDEGQDFGDSRIMALYELLEGDGSQWLYFGDNKQDLYGQGTDESLGAEVIFRLYHNCRNTERVNTATNKVCSGVVRPMPGVPIGQIPYISFSKVDLMAQKAWSLVNELSPDGGAVILSPFKLDKSCMNSLRKAYGLNLTEDISKLGEPDFVFYSTIKSFKGLEARHVVFVDADKPGLNLALDEEDLYVAFTRATARLDIITSNKEAESWFSSLLNGLK